MKKIYLLSVLLAFATFAFATPYIPPEQITTHFGRTVYKVPVVDATYNHMSEFCQISAFEQPLQCEDPNSNYGGQREEESGPYWSIIETDNTLEAIWLWSRYYELTGDAQYNDEIADAWIYANVWPAWLEGAGYYSSHNCAWGLAAELKYRTVFNDSSQWNYAVNCANYIIQTELPFTADLNVMVTGWCCGNLYLYGLATNNQNYMRTAVVRARQITAWVEQNPTQRLALEAWAMSSGTFVWGICKSYFLYDPAVGQAWLSIYGPMVQVYEPTTTGWSNAWNVAYCNAQGAMFDVTGNQTYANNHLALTNLLLRYDYDNDGGIPASAIGTVDASWTSSYLAMMGCDYYLGTLIDAGVLIINSPRNNSALNLGSTIPITVTVGNWGTSTLNNVMLTISGVFQDTAFVNLNPGQNQTLTLGQWTPTIPGIDSLWATVFAEGDTVAFNDSDISRFRIRTLYESDGFASLSEIAPSGYNLSAYPNPFNAQTVIQFSLPEAEKVSLAVYNLAGQEVAQLLEGNLDAGYHAVNWNAQNLASGIYFLILRAEAMTNKTNFVERRKMVLMK